MHTAKDAVTKTLLQQLRDKVGADPNAFATLFRNKKTGNPYTGGFYANVERGTNPISDDLAEAVLDTLADALRLYASIKRIVSESTPAPKA